MGQFPGLNGAHVMTGISTIKPMAIVDRIMGKWYEKVVNKTSQGLWGKLTICCDIYPFSHVNEENIYILIMQTGNIQPVDTINIII